MAILLALTPKFIDYLNESPIAKRNLEQQIQYNNDLIKNYPYSNLYIVRQPKGDSWKKLIARIKSKTPMTVAYCSKYCIPCIYVKEYFIGLAKTNKDKLFFIIDYHHPEGKDLHDSLENYDFNESSFPTLVIYKNCKKEKFEYSRYGLFILTLKEKIPFL